MSSLVQPGAPETRADDFPRLKLPARESLFRDRAARFAQLAPGHSLEPFLRFMAALASAQQEALATLPSLPLPGAETLAKVRAHRMPPLAPAGIRRDPVWRQVLRTLVERSARALPESGRAAAAALLAADAATIEEAADALLDHRHDRLDPAWAPFLAAALEVYWVQLATTLGASAFSGSEPASLCPVCGSPPVASVLAIGGAEHGLRYLHCSLCDAEWHRVRAQCSNCDGSGELAYYGMENHAPWVQAEACGGCGSYLKLIRREKEPLADPVADDLATLALDLLMDEQGLARSGPNPFMIAT